MTDTKRHEIYLAALLHDIGKFYQRADSESIRKSKELRFDNIEKTITTICPRMKNDFKGNEEQWRYGYYHVLYTLSFLDQIKDSTLQRANLSPGRFEESLERKDLFDQFKNLAAYHHKPQEESNWQSLIQLADWWSSGMERTQTLKNPPQSEDIPSFFKDIPLNNFFDNIGNTNGKEAVRNQFYPVSEVSIEKGDHKSKPYKNIEKLQPQYEKLWSNFTNEFQQLETRLNEGGENFLEAWGESLLYLLRKYTTFIPASTHKKDFPEVSLFEHLKTTAAISVSIYDYLKGIGEEKLTVVDGKARYDIDKLGLPLRLYCCDFSGIQDFIYDIVDQKAAKSLKGRSFYLQLLSESLIQRIFKENQLFSANLIYNSGGKFFFLAPNLEKVNRKIQDFEKEVSKELFEYHGIKIFTAFASAPFAYDFHSAEGEIRIGDDNTKTTEIASIEDLWKKVSFKTGEKKSRRFSDYIAQNPKKFFNPSNQGGEGVHCAVTGEKLAEREEDLQPKGKDVYEAVLGDSNEIRKIAYKLDSDDDFYVNQTVYKQSSTGQFLRDADYFLTFKEPGEKLPSVAEKRTLNALDLGINHYLFNQKSLTKEESGFRFIPSADVAICKRINDPDFLKINELKGRETSYGFQFYGGNRVALNSQGKPKTFEELAAYDENGNELNFKRLGILRMDVDNLGLIFQKGMPNKSFAGYATFSNLLDYFFSGYINTIRNEYSLSLYDNDQNEEKKEVEYAFKDWVNVIYSGGDDIFAVGRWDRLIHFARVVRNAFEEFVGGREDVSLSAGLAMVPPKFPISKAANMAGEMEELAKSFKHPINFAEKNAFHFLNETVSWNKEFPEVLRLKELFLNIIYEKNQLSKSFLQNLQKFGNQAKENKSLSYVWISAYYLSRVIKDLKDERDEEKMKTVEFLEKLKKSLASGHLNGDGQDYYGNRYFNIAALAARWAELELRMTSKEEFSNH